MFPVIPCLLILKSIQYLQPNFNDLLAKKVIVILKEIHHKGQRLMMTESDGIENHRCKEGCGQFVWHVLNLNPRLREHGSSTLTVLPESSQNYIFHIIFFYLSVSVIYCQKNIMCCINMFSRSNNLKTQTSLLARYIRILEH